MISHQAGLNGVIELKSPVKPMEIEREKINGIPSLTNNIHTFDDLHAIRETVGVIYF